MARRSRRLAVGGALVGILISTPVVALAAVQAADSGGQPAPGTSVQKTTDTTTGTQPPAGTSVAKTTDVVVGQQPANPNPQDAGPPLQLQHSANDAGVKNLAPKEDGGTQNLPVQAE